MKWRRGSSFLLAMVFVFLSHSPAFSENYAGFGLGVSIPHDVTDFKGSDGTFDVTLTDFSPDSSLAFGFKVGHYFEALPFLGLEFNFSSSDPDVDKEKITATITGTPGGVFTGQASGDFLGTADVSHLSTFGFLVMLRATEKQSKQYLFGLGPYLGLGFGVNLLDVDKATIFNTGGGFIAETTGDSSAAVGFLLSAGLNYKLTDHVKAYGEYKYKEMNFEFDALDEGVKYEFDASESSLIFGLSYSF